MSGDSGPLKELEHCVSSQDARREACSVMYNGAIQIWRDRNHWRLGSQGFKKIRGEEVEPLIIGASAQTPLSAAASLILRIMTSASVNLVPIIWAARRAG